MSTYNYKLAFQSSYKAFISQSNPNLEWFSRSTSYDFARLNPSELSLNDYKLHTKYLFQLMKLDINDLSAKTLTINNKYTKLTFKYFDSLEHYYTSTLKLWVPLYCVELPSIKFIYYAQTRLIIVIPTSSFDLESMVKIPKYNDLALSGIYLDNVHKLLYCRLSFNISSNYSVQCYKLSVLRCDDNRTGEYFDIDIESRRLRYSKIYLRQLASQYKLSLV